MCQSRAQPSNYCSPLLSVLSLPLDRSCFGVARLCAFDRGAVAFACECTGIAFKIRGSTGGSIVSLMTAAGGLVKVTGIFRCTSKFTVSSSCFNRHKKQEIVPAVVIVLRDHLTRR